MTPERLRRRRAAAQLLGSARPASLPAAVAHLLAVQAQDLRGARLALRARGAARAAADVDAALGAARSVVVAWLMRGTLHLVAREDYAWLHALTGRQNAATIRRRLGQLGVSDPERGLSVIERALGADGPLERAALGERLREAGVSVEGQALPHLLGLAASRGTVVRAGEAFALTEDWLGPIEPPRDRAAALAELARRYLRGHGPVTAADLAAWSGVGLRDARAGLSAIAGELRLDGGLADLARRTRAPAAPPRLLPAFDSFLLGWRDRSFAVPAAHARRVHPGGGIVRATAIADGAAVGTWTMPGGTVALEPFAPLPAAVTAALEADARRVEAF